MDAARGRHDFGPVKAWVDAGASVELIRSTVLDILARPGGPKGRVSSLRYFDRAVVAALEAARAPAFVVARDSADEAARVAAVEARIQDALRGRPMARAA
jgi:hypothetical protein